MNETAEFIITVAIFFAFFFFITLFFLFLAWFLIKTKKVICRLYSKLKVFIYKSFSGSDED